MERQEQATEFARALCRYVAQELRDQDGEYVRGAVKVADARNHLFMPLPHQGTLPRYIPPVTLQPLHRKCFLLRRIPLLMLLRWFLQGLP